MIRKSAKDYEHWLKTHEAVNKDEYPFYFPNARIVFGKIRDTYLEDFEKWRREQEDIGLNDDREGRS
ncbi:MAG: hypothetical protein ACHQ1D_01910 [Nitrososphaerales archaeon]